MVEDPRITYYIDRLFIYNSNNRWLAHVSKGEEKKVSDYDLGLSRIVTEKSPFFSEAEVDDCSSLIKSSHDDPIIALLMSLLPNLQMLVMGNYPWGGPTDYLLPVVGQSAMIHMRRASGLAFQSFRKVVLDPSCGRLEDCSD